MKLLQHGCGLKPVVRGFAALAVLSVMAGSLARPLSARATWGCYVNGSLVGGANTGWSWADAFHSLTTALSACAGGQIWVAAGVYKPGPWQSDTFNIQPGTQVYGGFGGWETFVWQRSPLGNVTILSGDIDNNDDNAGTTQIDDTTSQIHGANSYHVVTMIGTGTPITGSTVLDSFVVTGGDAQGAIPDGGGLACDGGGAGHACSPTLNLLIFSGNRADFGGAIYANGDSGGAANPAISYAVFTGNMATSYGGAIFAEATAGTSSPSAFSVTFANNSAAQSGGAFYASADQGGTSDPAFLNVNFDSNQAVAYGGAVYATGSTGTSNALYTLVTFSNNTAHLGGAIYNAGTNGATVSPTLTNVTFSGNTAGDKGGAMYSDGSGGQSSPSLTNVTFSGNSANWGGALSNNAASGASNPALTNVILWGNTAGALGPEIYNVSSAAPSIDHSLIQGSKPGGIWDTSLGTDVGGNLDADPLLGPLQNNGGMTYTMALGPGSPAIDTGTNTGCPGFDQRLGIRPVDGNEDGTLTCDIGAVEYLPGHVFADMPVTGKEWMEPWVNMFYFKGVSSGCGLNPLVYCPENSVTRAEMAVFLLRAKHGLGYAPPPASHYFADMPVAGKEWMEAWVDEFYREGLTTGCGTGPLIYCPENNVTREEMAVFILRATHASGYSPAATSGIFSDMPVIGKEWMESWVDEFYNEGITTGCASAPLRYCPENNVTRAEMAVFIDRAFHLYP